MLNANHLTLPAGDMYNFESQHMLKQAVVLLLLYTHESPMNSMIALIVKCYYKYSATTKSMSTGKTDTHTDGQTPDKMISKHAKRRLCKHTMGYVTLF